MLQIGQPINGFMGGAFGRDSYGDRRIEAVGYDWIVTRGDDGVEFWSGDLKQLEKDIKEEEKRKVDEDDF